MKHCAQQLCNDLQTPTTTYITRLISNAMPIVEGYAALQWIDMLTVLPSRLITSSSRCVSWLLVLFALLASTAVIQAQQLTAPSLRIVSGEHATVLTPATSGGVQTIQLPSVGGTLLTSGNGLLIGGNAPTGSLLIGSTNANNVVLISNSVQRISIDTSGVVAVAGQLKVNAADTTKTISFPTGRGAAGQVLSLGSNGALSWVNRVDTYFDMTPGKRDTIFDYTGAEQVFVVPAGIRRLTLEVWGAAGVWYYLVGVGGYGRGGGGGYVSAAFPCTPGDTLYVYVGGQATWNGGGTGTNANGGDATDIRYGGRALANRIIVAGGGGAATGYMIGGPGGDGSRLFYDLGGPTFSAWHAFGGKGGYAGNGRGTDNGGAGWTSGVQGAGGGGGLTAGGGGVCLYTYGCLAGVDPQGYLGLGGDGKYAGGGGYYGGGGVNCIAGNGEGAGGGGSSWVSPTLCDAPAIFIGNVTEGVGKARISW